MINETTKKLSAEATKVAEDVKARAETFAGEFQERAKAFAEKGQDYARDAVEFQRGNVEALVESAKIAAKGAEAIGQEVAAFTMKSFEDSSAAAKRYSAVKTPTEFFQLQTELTRTAVDAMVKHGAKTTELSVKMANDAFQPISNRIALAVNKIKSAA